MAAALAFSHSASLAQSLSAPTSLGATTYSKSQINLLWNDPNPGPSGNAESGYIVERGKGAPTGWSQVFTSGPNVTSWSSTGLSTGTLYYYRVRAFLVVGGQTVYSAYSPVASATTQSNLYPNPPTGLTATVLSETRIALSWQDKANNETGYKVQRAPSASGPWSLLASTGTNQVSYTDSGLTPATSYSYRVKATNATGASPPSNAVTATTKPDLTPPTVSITSPASGTTYTAPGTVVITASASDNVGVRRVEFYDGVTLKGTATAAPYTYAWPVTSAGNGAHAWTARAYDATNSSVSSQVSLTVNIPVSTGDTTAPTGSLTINNGAAFTNGTVVTLSLSATDTVGVTGHYVSSNSTTPTLATPGWTGGYSTAFFNYSLAFTVPSGDGTKTVYAWFRDAAGNVSASASRSIVLDQTAPANGSLTATPGNGQISLSWAGFTDTGSGLSASAPYKLVYSTSGLPASCSAGTVLVSGTSTSFMHTGLANGVTHSYRACAVDKAGNMSTGATASATLQGSADTTPPTGSLAINGNAASTSSTGVTLSLSATDGAGVTGYYLSTASTTPAPTATGWAAVAATTSYSGSVPYTLSSGDGTKTLYVWYKDAAGNVSAPVSRSIVLDQTAPTNGSLTAAPGNGQVSLSWVGFTDAGSGLSSSAPYKLVYSISGLPASCSAGTVLVSGTGTSYTHTALTNGTTYSYRVCAMDSAGNVSSGATASAVPQAVDTTAPAGSLRINGGAAYAGATAVTLNVSATDGAGVTAYYISTSATPPAATATGWTGVTPTTSYNASLGYTLSSGDGTKTVYAWYKDAAGNVSSTASASILLDQTAPSTGTLTATPSSGQVALSWSGISDGGSGLAASAPYKLVFSIGATPVASCGSGTLLYSGSGTSVTHSGLTDGTTYSYRVCATDRAGNISIGATASAAPQAGSTPNPTLVGFVPGIGTARDVVVDDVKGLAYVASGEFGLAIADISNPAAPVVLGAANPPFYGAKVAVAGTLAVVTGNALGLWVVDVSIPTGPKTIGGLTGTMTGVGVGGQCLNGTACYAYVLQGVAGTLPHTDLIVVDLHAPAAPTVVGRVTVAGGANLKVVGSLVYVAAAGAGLQIVDVSTPTAPRIIATLDTPGGAKGVDVANGYAYVADNTSIQIIRVTTPSSPVIVGSLPTTASTAVAVAGTRLYALDGPQLSIIDVTNPALPLLLAAIDSRGAQGLDASGTVAYLASPATGLSGLYLVDAGVPGTGISTGFENTGLAVAGSLAVVTGGTLGMKVVDVSVPTSPTAIGSLGGTMTGVAMAGQCLNNGAACYAYVLQGVSGTTPHTDLIVVDLHLPVTPLVVGRVTMAGGGSVKVVGSYAYVAAGGAGLQIVNVSSPTAPQIIATLDTPGGAKAVAVANGYAYVADNTSIQVIRVTTPSSPVIVGSLGMTTATAVAVSGTRLYVIDGSLLKIVDVSNPAAPALLSATTSYSAQAVDVTGTLAFLAKPALNHGDLTGGVYVIDVSNPAQPTFVDQIIVPGTTRTVVATPSFVYVGDSAAIVDVIQLAP